MMFFRSDPVYPCADNLRPMNAAFPEHELVSDLTSARKLTIPYSITIQPILLPAVSYIFLIADIHMTILVSSRIQVLDD